MENTPVKRRAPRAISWYRTPLESKDMKSLHERSDFLGLCQSLGYLGLLVVTGSVAYYSAGHWVWPLTLALVFLHGTCFSFMPNAVHELGHGTVFQTKALNAIFVRIFSFLGWINFEMFSESHARHHRYTLHIPDDLEVVLPFKIIVRDFFLQGFVNVKGFFASGVYSAIKDTVRLACGNFQGEWENTLYPPNDPKRSIPVNWARTMLAGHALIVAVSLYFHLWMIPVLTTFASFYGNWLFFLCNNTQHIGLQDDVPDFRLCCRTFTLNPVVQFLYWYMNFHTDHHMYAAVPCYNLPRLHRLIKRDLPPCPHGLIATWWEIAKIQRLQKKDPSYQHIAPLPNDPRAENHGAGLTPGVA